jgi:choline monooxygenase
MSDIIYPDITMAETIPSRYYTELALFERSKEAIFAPAWHWVGDDDKLQIPGAIWPQILLEGFLDEPIVFTRDTADTLHCLSNVCTHRGMLVAESPGNARFLRCRYHGRRFGLAGDFQHMPEFEEVQGFPSPTDCLTKIPFAQWGPWLFVRLAGERAFSETFGPMVERLSWLPLGEFVPAPERGRSYLVQSHWALYLDNYLEGFHIPFIHAGLNDVLDYENYETELFAGGNLQLAVAKDDEVCFDLPKSSPDYGRRIAAYYYWFFPNLMFNFYPWGLSINVVKPIAPDRTKVTFIPYVWRPDKLDQGAGSALDRVEREDEVVVEAVQRGVRSRFYDRGRYSVRREGNVHQFHRLLAAALEPSF